MKPITALVLTAFLSGCAGFGWFGHDEAPLAPPIAPRTAWIVSQSGHAIGQVTLTETRSGMLIRLEFSPNALPEGWHAAHVHQIGDCSDFSAGFLAAGVHEGQVAGSQHGFLNPNGPEAGDLPNLYAPPGGAPFGVEFFTSRLTLRSPPARERYSLLDANGAALVIHERADSHTAVPGGARIACAALTPTP